MQVPSGGAAVIASWSCPALWPAFVFGRMILSSRRSSSCPKDRAAMVGCQAVVGIGDILAAKYKVEKTLGKGGMGYVVAARHLQLDQQVAIKILVPELTENEDA